MQMRRVLLMLASVVSLVAAGGAAAAPASAGRATYTGDLWSPSWAPRGNAIAFYRLGDVGPSFVSSSAAGLYLAAGGRPAQRIEKQPVDGDLSFAWSPDGTRLAYLRGWGSLVVRRVDGVGQPAWITGDSTAKFSWSPDGTRIAYTQNEVDDLWVARADASARWKAVLSHPFLDGQLDGQGGPRLNSDAVEDWTWSPDGRTLALLSVLELSGVGGVVRTILTVDAAGGPAQYVHDEGNEGAVQGPAWSPDGHFLAYSAISPGYTGPTIVHVDASGRDWAWRHRSYSPVWSSKGLLAFVEFRGTQAPAVVVAAPFRTQDMVRRFTHASDPVWSPDGRRLSFRQRGHAVVADLRSGAVRDLGPARSVGVWAPDSRLIALERAGHVIVAEGGGRAVHDLGRGESVSWSPDSRQVVFRRQGCGRTSGVIVAEATGASESVLARPRQCVIKAGGGNIVRGSALDDIIGAQDGRRQFITCGPGHDDVTADLHDEIAKDCERVQRTSNGL